MMLRRVFGTPSWRYGSPFDEFDRLQTFLIGIFHNTQLLVLGILQGSADTKVGYVAMGRGGRLLGFGGFSTF